MIIGLTGGIGSGKSTVAELFARKQIHIVDADTISHTLTQAGQPALQEICSYFGSAALHSDGQLNRAWLRDYIHKTPTARSQLENILHPLIAAECAKQLQNGPQSSYQILMVPLLIEHSEFKFMCDKIVVVESDLELRIARVMQRNQIKRETVVAIINNQASDEVRRQEADFLIYNNGTLESLSPQVDRIDLLLRVQSNISAQATPLF